MNICVIGAGAIGGWVAAKLAECGETVMALNSRGLLEEIELSEAGKTRTIRLSRFEGPADLLILAAKATALQKAAETAEPLIGPDTIIVPMLNGVPWWFVEGMQLRSIDPDGSIAARLPFEQVIGCVVHAAVSRSPSGAINVKFADKLIIGEPGGEESRRLAGLYSVFKGAGLNPDLTGNIRRAIWYKLWGNATTNPLSALVRATTDKLHADKECRQWTL
ncbi:MAG TPA: 2-dehydropantoate 2-reductase N-terminal domain-containing protein, partial [Sphingomicrobium sp.]|nr:2-dehydropantoate 2-reductase N-terminal domain-containing protein [Sphingomicrobium sp.]